MNFNGGWEIGVKKLVFIKYIIDLEYKYQKFKKPLEIPVTYQRYRIYQLSVKSLDESS